MFKLKKLNGTHERAKRIITFFEYIQELMLINTR